MSVDWKSFATMDYEWGQPAIRSALQIDGAMVPIPTAFWRVAKVQPDGHLTRADEKLLWSTLGRKGRAPKNLSDRIALWRPDVEARFPQVKNGQR